MQTLGLIGVGNMGRPIAHNLLEAGYALRVYDINPQASAQLAKLDGRAGIVSNIAATVEPGGVVFSMVPDDNSLEDIALCKDGVLASLGPGGVHVSLSTVSPRLAQKLEPMYQAQGASYISSTVVGRPDVAATAKLTVYLSGNPQAKERVLPPLTTLGRIANLGEKIRAANVAKLATNHLILSALAAMGEAAAMIEDSGGDPAKVLEIIGRTPLFSGIVYQQYGRMVGQKDFGDALFPVGMGLKDAQLILDFAMEIGREMPSTWHAFQALLKALAAGRDAEDWSVLSQYVSRRLPLAV